MQIENYLSKNQKVVYKTFLNALSKKSLSHAYLLVGNQGTPLLEVAHYLAKSILCDDPSPFACNSCITCLRIDTENYPDFLVFNGEKSTIVKDHILQIESSFEKKAFEKKGIQIYILHLVENMTEEAVNSLLKFLEEPDPNVYAFLTTNNEGNVLPTIISRCQTLKLISVPREQIINESIALNIDLEDAEYLSFFINDANLLFEFTQDKEKYKEFCGVKTLLREFLTSLATDKKEAVYYAQKAVSPSLKSKQSARFFIDMLSQIFEDLVKLTFEGDILLKSQEDVIMPLKDVVQNPNEILLEILKMRNMLNLNANIPLLIDHLVFEITKER